MASTRQSSESRGPQHSIKSVVLGSSECDMCLLGAAGFFNQACTAEDICGAIVVYNVSICCSSMSKLTQMNAACRVTAAASVPSDFVIQC